MNRLLRWVLRLDQAGSAAFIVVALAAVPALVLVGPTPVVLWVLGVGVILYAAALAALGVLMAWGLSRSAIRGQTVSSRLWKSILLFSDDGHVEWRRRT
ncbi:hypothetical protein [Amycolatopsis alkalitolerans]|uniref:Uncharacterized protein n=1 Tax=Amycolatopsis alkalitolerans TaxID=2547244 RepID=A0A5C4LVX9_9PSEU|nr:hypothetical protein [Amycolatopsis alkalitolerans]TNC22099.1 hypothetical protein FG385_26485 [Amycolatopsis alkalitolerans]